MSNENTNTANLREAEGTNETAIDLRVFFTVFLDNILLIAGVTAAALIAALIFFTVTYSPRYSSTATLYILRTDNESAPSSSDFTLAMNVVNDCKYALKSPEVLNAALEKAALTGKYTANTVANSIGITNPSSTRFLEIKVTAKTPDEAKALTDNLCDCAKEKMEKVMGFNQVNVFKYGDLPTKASNRRGLKDYAIVGAAALVLTYGVLLLVYILNDTLETDDDFTKRLNLTVLATIPDASAVGGGKKYGYGKRYGYDKQYGYGSAATAETKKDGGKENGKK